MTIVMLKNGICAGPLAGLFLLLGPRTNNMDMVVGVDEKVAEEERREIEDKRRVSPTHAFLGRQGSAAVLSPSTDMLW